MKPRVVLVTGVSRYLGTRLAATLAAVPSVPVESLALLVGIDRFMSECRAITNLIGNGVATLVISRWENEVTGAELNERLLGSSATSSGAPQEHPRPV